MPMHHVHEVTVAIWCGIWLHVQNMKLAESEEGVGRSLLTKWMCPDVFSNLACDNDKSLCVSPLRCYHLAQMLQPLYHKFICNKLLPLFDWKVCKHVHTGTCSGPPPPYYTYHRRSQWSDLSSLQKNLLSWNIKSNLTRLKPNAP